MDTNSFSYKTLKNSSYLFMGFLLPMAFTIFVTRTMVLKLGSAEYGIFLLVNAVSAFINYVDLGLSTSVTKYAAEYQASGNFGALENLLSSSRIMFLITGLVGFVVFLVLGKWFLPAFHVSAESVPHIFTVFLLAGVVFFLSSLTTIYSAALSALQRFDLLTKLSLFSLIVTSLGTIGLLEMNFRLKAVMGLNVVVTFGTLLFYHFYVLKLMPEVRLKFILVKSEIRKAYGFGLLAFVSNLASSSLVYLDRLIIPVFLGPSQLAFYSVPGNVSLKVTGVTNSLAGMFFPMASGFFGTGEMDRLKNIYIRAFRNLSVAAAATTVAIMLFGNKILLFWLGPEYAARGTGVLLVSTVTYYIISLYLPLQSILMGLGKLNFLISQSLFMAGVNFLLLLIMIPRFGIIGAAWAYFISVLPMIYGFYWAERKLFGLKGQGSYYSALYAKLLATALADGLIIYFAFLPLVKNVWILAVVGPISVLLYPALYLAFGFMETEDYLLFKSFFFILKNKVL